MILINLYGGPGTGKSTAAAHLFAALKAEEFKTELVGEAAKEIVYDRIESYWGNQFLISALQYQRIVRLADHGCQVAISDSPLLGGLAYTSKFFYYPELSTLLRKLNESFKAYNVFLTRTVPFSSFGRNEATEEAAAKYDARLRELADPIWLEIPGDSKGRAVLVESVKDLLC